jgi:hypothetical protein
VEVSPGFRDSSLGQRAREVAATRRFQAAAALAGFTALSFVLFGLPVAAHPSRSVIGYGTDPATFMWFLRWWPHALAHGLNPFFTHALWAPYGFNLAATTSIPGPSLVAIPITEAFGPVVAFNLLTLLAPALSAWTGYLLCRHVTDRFWASVFGGWLFGFSAYELGQLMGHLNLAMVFMVPVCVLLAVRRIEGEIGPRRFVVLLAASLVAQLLISPEVALTMTVFGGLALLLAVVLAPGELRQAVLSAARLVGVAYAITAVVLIPYLALFFSGRSTEAPIYPFYPSFYALDATNLAVPVPTVWLGRRDFAGLATMFTGNVSEQGGYLGLPVLGMVFMFAVTRWRDRTTRFLLAVFAVVLVAAMGTILHVAGITTVALPWRLAVHVPLVKYALPSRFVMYAALAAAVMAAQWLARPGSNRWTKAILVALAVVFLFPNLGSHFWNNPVDTPVFFSTGLYREYLQPGDNVVVIPYAGNGNAMLWQAETGFWFRMPEGYLTVTPPKRFADDPLLNALYTGQATPQFGEQLRAFVRELDIRAIVVDPRLSYGWDRLLASQRLSGIAVGGVLVYRIPPGYPG